MTLVIYIEGSLVWVVVVVSALAAGDNEYPIIINFANHFVAITTAEVCPLPCAVLDKFIELLKCWGLPATAPVCCSGIVLWITAYYRD